MALFEDLLHAAENDATCFDALLRGCGLEVYENLRVRRVLRCARGSLDIPAIPLEIHWIARFGFGSEVLLSRQPTAART
jgi:hypothetical protein